MNKPATWQEELMNGDARKRVAEEEARLKKTEQGVPSNEVHRRAVHTVYEQERTAGRISDAQDLYGPGH